MRARSLLRRRPSASLVVSFLALFVSLGGAGWAALRLPPHSVGNAQLQNFSVGNAKLRPASVGASKIIPGSVAARQVNSSQVQLRLTSGCLIGAIQSIAQTGNLTCTPTLPNEYGMLQHGATPLTGTYQQVAAVSLPAAPGGSSYLAIGNVRVDEREGVDGQTVDVSCLMSLAGSHGTEGNFVSSLGGTSPGTNGTIPLILPISVAGAPQTVTIDCAESSVPATPAPSVGVVSTINAIQTAANNDS